MELCISQHEFHEFDDMERMIMGLHMLLEVGQQGQGDFQQALCIFIFILHSYQQLFRLPISSIMRSSLGLSSFTPLERVQLVKVKTIWQSLHDNNDATQFRRPVQWQVMGLLDYPVLIKYPTDLSCICRKLKEGRYAYVEEVLDEMQLIWDNCKTYNQRHSLIYNLADKLEKSLKKMIKSYLPEIHFLKCTAPIKLKEEPVVSQPIEEEVSYAEKIQFVDQMKMMTPDKLFIIVEEIRKLSAVALEEKEEGRSEIRIDKINCENMRAISEKMQEILDEERPATKKLRMY